MFVGVVLLSQQYTIELLNVCRCCHVISTVQYIICLMIVGVVLLSQQYSIDLLNVCRCCPVISTVQYRSVKSLWVLSCYLNITE